MRHVLQLEHLSDHFFGFADRLFAGTSIPRMKREIPGPGSGEHKMQNVGANSFATFAAMWAGIAAGRGAGARARATNCGDREAGGVTSGSSPHPFSNRAWIDEK